MLPASRLLPDPTRSTPVQSYRASLSSESWGGGGAFAPKSTASFSTSEGFARSLPCEHAAMRRKSVATPAILNANGAVLPRYGIVPGTYLAFAPPCEAALRPPPRPSRPSPICLAITRRFSV